MLNYSKISTYQIAHKSIDSMAKNQYNLSAHVKVEIPASSEFTAHTYYPCTA